MKKEGIICRSLKEVKLSKKLFKSYCPTDDHLNRTIDDHGYVVVFRDEWCSGYCTICKYNSCNTSSFVEFKKLLREKKLKRLL